MHSRCFWLQFLQRGSHVETWTLFLQLLHVWQFAGVFFFCCSVQLTGTAACDDYDGEQDEPEDDEVHETDFAALLGSSGEDPEADDALAEAAAVADAGKPWSRGSRFSGKGKSKSKGKGKAMGKGNNKGSNLSFRGAQEASCRAQEPRTTCHACGCARTLGQRRHLVPRTPRATFSPQPPARGYLALGGETSGFDLALLGWRYVCRVPQPWSLTHASMPATSRWRHRRRHADDRGNPPRVIPSPPPPTPQCAWRV